MGVDFYVCEVCGNTFPDCGDFVSCECGGRFCSNDCAHMDYAVYDDEGEGTEDDGPGTCVLCRGEEATDGELISWLLERCKLTREAAIILMAKEEGPYVCKHNIPSYADCKFCPTEGCCEG